MLERRQNVGWPISIVMFCIAEDLLVQGLSQQCRQQSPVVLISHPASVVALCDQIVESVEGDLRIGRAVVHIKLNLFAADAEVTFVELV